MNQTWIIKTQKRTRHVLIKLNPSDGQVGLRAFEQRGVRLPSSTDVRSSSCLSEEALHGSLAPPPEEPGLLLSSISHAVGV